MVPVVPEPVSSQDMLAYSGSNMLCIKTGSFPPHMQKLQGAVRGDIGGWKLGGCRCSIAGSLNQRKNTGKWWFNEVFMRFRGNLVGGDWNMTCNIFQKQLGSSSSQLT